MMNSTPLSKLLSEEDALRNLQSAFGELQQTQEALAEQWGRVDLGEGQADVPQVTRLLKTVSDQAQQLQAALDLLGSIRRYRQLLGLKGSTQDAPVA